MPIWSHTVRLQNHTVQLCEPKTVPLRSHTMPLWSHTVPLQSNTAELREPETLPLWSSTERLWCHTDYHLFYLWSHTPHLREPETVSIWYHTVRLWSHTSLCSFANPKHCRFDAALRDVDAALRSFAHFILHFLGIWNLKWSKSEEFYIFKGVWLIFNPCGLNSDGKKWCGGSNSDFWDKHIPLGFSCKK